MPDVASDTISFIQVLENIENPLDTLIVAREHMKYGGLLVLDVLSFNNPRIIVYRLTRLGCLVERDFIPSHCYCFTRRTLLRLVEKAGFKALTAQTSRYSMKIRDNLAIKMLDRLANPLGFGGITLYARKT